MKQEQQYKTEIENRYLNINEISILRDIQERKKDFNTYTIQDNLNLIEDF